jgi:hypothetical protein
MIEHKIAHLTLIQNVITRMAGNSFLVKGWVITVVAALGAFFTGNPDARVLMIALGVTIVFWFMDGYYLYLERSYRLLYESVANDHFQGSPFQMSVREKNSFGKLMLSIFSLAQVVFYTPIMCVVVFHILKIVFATA